MLLRPLMIDDEAKAKVARVLDYAERHHYRPGLGVPSPGDDERYVAHLDTYTAVFTFTHSEGVIWRHLSVSVPSDKYPNLAAAFVIAELFGFTGWDGRTIDRIPKEWGMDINEKERCIVLLQPCGREGSVVH